MAHPPELQSKLARLPDGSPDWDAIELEVRCGRCDYNLRTLSNPRCPECGLAFEWTEVLDRAARHTEFLFEQAFRSRPIRSYLLTWWRCLRPKSFWQRVSIHERVRIQPLLCFVVMTIATSMALLLVAARGLAMALSLAITSTRGTAIAPDPWIIRAHYQLNRLSLNSPQPFSRGHMVFDYRFWLIPIAMFLGLFGIFIFLAVLHQTLARFRIRRVQLLRIVAYAAPTICTWCCTLLLIFACLLPFARFAGPIPFIPFSGSTMTWLPNYSPFQAPLYQSPYALNLFDYLVFYTLLLVGFIVTFFSVGIPLRDYLRIPQPWRLALLGTFIAALLPTSILAFLSLVLSGNW